MDNSRSPPPVLIVGAGITGTLFAQFLKKNSIPFRIFERDPHEYARGKGWGITIHWALDAMLSLLPAELVQRLPEVYVDADAIERGETGKFQFFDLRSGKDLLSVTPGRRIRVSREKLRRLLMTGLDVEVCLPFLY